MYIENMAMNSANVSNSFLWHICLVKCSISVEYNSSNKSSYINQYARVTCVKHQLSCIQIVKFLHIAMSNPLQLFRDHHSLFRLCNKFLWLCIPSLVLVLKIYLIVSKEIEKVPMLMFYFFFYLPTKYFH